MCNSRNSCNHIIHYTMHSTGERMERKGRLGYHNQEKLHAPSPSKMVDVPLAGECTQCGKGFGILTGK